MSARGVTHMFRWFRVIWYVLALRCDEADRVRCAPDPEDLPGHKRFAERAHRALCGSCRAAKKRLDDLSRSLKDRDLETEDDADGAGGPGLDDAARQRLVNALRNDR